MEINLYIADAKKLFSEQDRRIIQNGVACAKEYATPRLPLCVFPKDFLEKIIQKHQLQNMCHVQNRSGLVFDTDGSILPCNSMVEVKIGKIEKDFTNSATLLELLNREDIRRGYKEMLRYPSAECDTCNYNDVCRGGCIVNWTVLKPEICHRITT